MKKLLHTYLVIVLTLMTVISMFSFKNPNIVETSKTPDETFLNESKPDDAGLIFDDNGENINIPYKPVHKNETKKDSKYKKKESLKNNSNIKAFQSYKYSLL